MAATRAPCSSVIQSASTTSPAPPTAFRSPASPLPMPLSNPPRHLKRKRRSHPPLPKLPPLELTRDERSLRIAHVTEYYYPHLGGICEHVHFFAREARRRGHHVDVITSHIPGGSLLPKPRSRAGGSGVPSSETRTVAPFAGFARRCCAI